MLSRVFRVFADQEKLAAPRDALSGIIEDALHNDTNGALGEDALEQIFAARKDCDAPNRRTDPNEK